MAYLFGAATSDNITISGAATAATFSIFARLQLAAVDQTDRFIFSFNNPTGQLYQVYFLFSSTGGINNRLRGGFSYNDGLVDGVFSNDVFWTSGFTAGTIHTVVLTYDGSDLKIYADTDATAKASSAETHTPDSTGLSISLGNVFFTSPGPPANSLAGTLYEVGWYPGTVLTGAQAAQLGGADASGVPTPGNYYRLIRDGADLFGGDNGTVTGATLVDTTGTHLYPFPTLGANWVDYHQDGDATIAAKQALTIVGNRVQPLSPVRVSDMEGLVGVTLPDDQWAQVTMTTFGVGTSVSVGVRFAAAPDRNGYQLLAVAGSPSTLYLLKLVDNGTTVTATTLDSTTFTAGSGSTLRLEVIGTVLTGYLNDVPTVTATDATYASGTAAIFLSNPSDATQAELDDFYAGDFAAFTPTTLDPMALTWTGQNLALNAKTMLALTAANLEWTGQDISFNARTQIALDPMALTWTGGQLGDSLDPMVLTWTGKELAVTGPGGPVVVPTGPGGKDYLLELRRRRRAGR